MRVSSSSVSCAYCSRFGSSAIRGDKVPEDVIPGCLEIVFIRIPVFDGVPEAEKAKHAVAGIGVTDGIIEFFILKQGNGDVFACLALDVIVRLRVAVSYDIVKPVTEGMGKAGVVHPGKVGFQPGIFWRGGFTTVAGGNGSPADRSRPGGVVSFFLMGEPAIDGRRKCSSSVSQFTFPVAIAG